MGDRSTSTEESLEHAYNEIGTYQISFTISNEVEQTTVTTNYTISSIPTGIDDVLGELSEHDLKVYPNPVTEFVHFNFPSNWNSSTIQIYSTSGKLVYLKQTQNPEYTIDCNVLPRGLNIVVVNNGVEKRTARLMVLGRGE